MNLMTALQDLADRLGLDPPPHRGSDGGPRWIFLTLVGLASLALWVALGYGLARLLVGLAA